MIKNDCVHLCKGICGYYDRLCYGVCAMYTVDRLSLRQVIQKNIRFFILLIISILNKKDISCKVPGSTKFNHGGIGVIISSETRMGVDCIIGQNVTIGEIHQCHPVIGDGVVIHANSCVLGGIVVGHHSVVGAGSVVIHDVPPLSVVVGNPAHVVKSISMEEYRGYRAGEKL